MQLAVRNASQPPQMIAKVLEKRRSNYEAASPQRADIETKLKEDTWHDTFCFSNFVHDLVSIQTKGYIIQSVFFRTFCCPC
eukprot:Skav204522  [mRNA]  locus=scaffold3201:412883:413125:+ [translate_table: standard]